MREDEKRDSIRYALRDALEAHAKEISVPAIPSEVVLDAFLESLDNRGLSVDESPPRHYHSNGEAGDGQMVCAGCHQDADDPHTWSDCAKALNKEVDAAVTYSATLESERDQARAHAERLRQELEKAKGRS